MGPAYSVKHNLNPRCRFQRANTTVSNHRHYPQRRRRRSTTTLLRLTTLCLRPQNRRYCGVFRRTEKDFPTRKRRNWKTVDSSVRVTGDLNEPAVQRKTGFGFEKGLGLYIEDHVVWVSSLLDLIDWVES